MNRAIYFICLFLVVLLLVIMLLSRNKEETYEIGLPDNFITSLYSLEGASQVEFKFVNISPNTIEVYYEYSNSAPLDYITTLGPSETKYVYPKNIKAFQPGLTLFTKFPEEPHGTYVYKPYKLKRVDYAIYFGEISTDFLRTKDVHSDRNEILSLQFENRSLKPYHIWYRGDYLGMVEGYHPEKKKIKYTILTTNSEKHFQLGTWLEFKMETAPGKLSPSQYIQIQGKNISDVNIGDIVGRDEGNA